MTNNALKAARAITRTLGEAEQSMEEAILTSAQLVARIVEARRETGVALAESQLAVADAVNCLRLAVSAQKALLSSHERLARSRDSLGIAPRAAGCTTTCLPITTDLRLVEPALQTAA